MIFLKKLGLLLLAVVASLFIPGLLSGLFLGGDGPDWLFALAMTAAGLILFGGVVYLAVDAAQRHNKA